MSQTMEGISVKSFSELKKIWGKTQEKPTVNKNDIFMGHFKGAWPFQIWNNIILFFLEMLSDADILRRKFHPH